jgi:hypothetical protein
MFGTDPMAMPGGVVKPFLDLPDGRSRHDPDEGICPAYRRAAVATHEPGASGIF